MGFGLAVIAAVLLGPPPEAAAVPTPDPDRALPAPPPVVVHVQRPPGAIFEHREDEGLVLRRVGLGVTIFGTILGIGGVMAAYSNPCGRDGARGSNCEVDVRNAVALIMGVTALGTLAGGIASMSIGYALHKRQRLASGFALRVGQGGGGMVFTARF